MSTAKKIEIEKFKFFVNQVTSKILKDEKIKNFKLYPQQQKQRLKIVETDQLFSKAVKPTLSGN